MENNVQLDDLFIAQEKKPAGLQTIDLVDLDPIQRVLLVADGTVTQLIEAHALQSVDILVLDQQIRRLEIDAPWLAADAGTEVCERQVVLLGGRDRVPYLYAVSLIAMDRVPVEVARGLQQKKQGIGRLLLHSGVESRRERLWFGIEQLQAPPEPIGHWTEVVSRTYRIIAGGRPLMLIEEKFPRSWTD